MFLVFSTKDWWGFPATCSSRKSEPIPTFPAGKDMENVRLNLLSAPLTGSNIEEKAVFFNLTINVDYSFKKSGHRIKEEKIYTETETLHISVRLDFLHVLRIANLH